MHGTIYIILKCIGEPIQTQTELYGCLVVCCVCDAIQLLGASRRLHRIGAMKS